MKTERKIKNALKRLVDRANNGDAKADRRLTAKILYREERKRRLNSKPKSEQELKSISATHMSIKAYENVRY